MKNLYMVDPWAKFYPQVIDFGSANCSQKEHGTKRGKHKISKTISETPDYIESAYFLYRDLEYPTHIDEKQLPQFVQRRNQLRKKIFTLHGRN